MRRAGVTWAGASVVLVGSITACASTELSSGSTDRAANDPGHYLLLAATTWKTQEMVDPLPDDPMSRIEQPALDWYAEYTRTSGSLDGPSGKLVELVRLSGHKVPLAEARRDLELHGLSFTDVKIDGWDAIGAVGSVDPSSPAMVVLGDAEMTFEILSHDVPLDDLVAMVGDIRRVDTTEWTAAGGVILSTFAAEQLSCEGEVRMPSGPCPGPSPSNTPANSHTSSSTRGG